MIKFLLEVIKMDIIDINVGQIVVDKFGNEYEVIDTDIPQCIAKLKCTKFVTESRVDPIFKFDRIDRILWVGSNGVYPGYDVHPDILIQTLELKAGNKNLDNELEELKKRVERLEKLVGVTNLS